MSAPLEVALGDRSYSIHFAADLTAAVAALVAGLAGDGKKIAVITDQALLRCQGERLTAMFGDAPLRAVPSGEGTKSAGQWSALLEFLAEAGLSRFDAVFAVGGGVVGDLAGFAAAAYLRGVDYYQIPTTLLAMVDSSVGGKTGINLAAGKNLAGAFHQPRGVFIATDVLATLPAREFTAGMAEVIKTGLLADRALFEAVERAPLRPGSPELPEIIRRCCAVKARIVSADERELKPEGGRALLNLGHTFAHAIERAAGYGEYLHGEAVAIGLAAAARLSAKLGGLSAGEVDRIDQVLLAHHLPLRLRAPLKRADLTRAMGRDKKVRGGELRFIVLRALGDAAVQGSVDAAIVDACWRDVGAE
jgi:3-dehydroquinate synthase